MGNPKDSDDRVENSGGAIWTSDDQLKNAREAGAVATPACPQGEARRSFLKSIGIVSLALLSCRATDAMAAPPSSSLWMPKEGDLLASGDTAKALTIQDIPESADPLTAFPFDPKDMEVRAKRFAGVLLLKFKDSELDPQMAKFAAGGVLAYSQVCVHAGCVISTWQPTTQTYFCGCHGSMFYPLKDGEVAGGPAPRPLPNLPLKLAADGKTLVVAASFNGSIGPGNR